jgi:CYTH domain-containing protein
VSHTEYNLPLTKESYEHLITKADGIVIRKDRYEIPDGKLTIELDIFHGVLEGLCWAEVEFPSLELAGAYQPPSWFGTEITGLYSNSRLSGMTREEAAEFVRNEKSLTSGT